MIVRTESKPAGFELGELSERAIASIDGATARINIWHGAVRSGKTINSLIAWGLRLATRPQDGSYMMIGKTAAALDRNCIQPLMQIFGAELCEYMPYQRRLFFAGRKVYLLDANDEGASDKIRGATVTDAYGDELTTWPESVFAMLLSRLSVPGARFYGTTNPDSPAHWLKARYLDRAAELNLKHWSFGLDDNLALPAEYKEAIKREYTGLWYRRFVLGDWTMAEGAVYENLDDAFLIPAEDERMQKAREGGLRYLSIDYGTSNAFVALECYIYRDALYVTNEFRWDSTKRGKKRTNSQYADDVQKFAGHPDLLRGVICDPSAASFILELRNRGFNVKPGKNEVLDGIRQTAALISQGRVYIAADNCAETIAELQGYRWDAKAAARGDEKPVKEADHGADALRYAVATLGLARKETEFDADIDAAIAAARIY